MKKTFQLRIASAMGAVLVCGSLYAADVATIGTTGYETLADAFDAAEPGQTITLTSDVAVDAMIPVTKAVTLDLAGHTITNNVTANRLFNVGNCTFTIEGNNGTVNTSATSYGVVNLASGSSDAKLVVNGGNFTGTTNDGAYFKYRTDGQTMELTNVNGNISADSGKGTVFINADQVNINLTMTGGNIVNNQPYAVILNGGSRNHKVSNSVVNISGLTASSAGGPVLRSDGKSVTVTDCTITAGSGEKDEFLNTALVSALGGKLTVNGGTYTGPYAVYGYNTGSDITINDGVFNGTVKIDEVNKDNEDYYAESTLTINNGTFNDKVEVDANSDCEIKDGQFKDTANLAKYCVGDKGMTLTPNAEGYYTLTTDAAAIGGTTYATLADAFAAAQAGDTVTLLHNTDETAVIAVNKDVTLDLNGKTISNNVANNRLFRVENCTFTIEGHEGTVITDATSFGVVDLTAPNADAKLIVNGGNFTGTTNDGAYFKYRTDGQTMEFTNVNGNISADSGNKTTFINGNSCSINLTMTGGNIVNNQAYSVVCNESTNGDKNDTENSVININGVTASSKGGPVVRSDGEMTVTNCNFTAGSENSTSYANTALAVAKGGKLTVNGGTYAGPYAVYGFNTGSDITINDGTFNGKVQIQEVDNAYYSDSKLTINNGTFNDKVVVDANSDCEIKGGSFKDTEGLDKYLPEGETFADAGNGYFQLGSIVTSVEGIETPEDANAEYFTLQGMRVSSNSLGQGIYIVRKGNKTSKVVIR